MPPHGSVFCFLDQSNQTSHLPPDENISDSISPDSLGIDQISIDVSSVSDIPNQVINH